MSDPWLSAADRIREERAAADRARTDEAEQRRLKLAQERADAERKRQEMEAAIAEAVPALERFLGERGAAAQAVMAARGEKSFITFGGYNEGGGYSNAFFYAHGLARESGRGGGYSPVETAGPKPISVEEAVRAYATDGAGSDRPDRVRNIVSWFEREINSAAGLNRD
jgi:hypothetical protein